MLFIFEVILFFVQSVFLSQNFNTYKFMSGVNGRLKALRVGANGYIHIYLFNIVILTLPLFKIFMLIRKNYIDQDLSEGDRTAVVGVTVEDAWMTYTLTQVMIMMMFTEIDYNKRMIQLVPIRAGEKGISTKKISIIIPTHSHRSYQHVR